MTDTINFRALCVNLLDCLEKADWPPRYRDVFGQWASVARTALAEPVAEPPAVDEGEDISELFYRHCCEVGDEVVGIVAQDAPAFARAVLARWGQPPASPAEGEVAELVAKLRRLAPQNPLGSADPTITRAAELLERHAAPVPVPVAERGTRHPECVKAWPDCWDGGYDPRCCRFPKSCSCGLPAHELPMAAPQGGEVEP